MRRLRASPESGAAVVEFTLVSVLLVTLFLAVLQLGLAIHVRNTLVACAAEGARYAANADRDAQDAVGRTRQLVGESLSDGLAQDIEASYVEQSGVRLVEVRLQAPLPLVGLLGPSSGLSVTAHAVAEVQ